MTDTTEKLNLWMPQVLGQYINEDWNIENQGFGAQCWDLAANWSKFLGLPVINTGSPGGRWPGWAGNMVDTFPQTPAIAAAYELISPDQPMQAGDIVVWDDSWYYYPKTHVAVGVQDSGALLLCASQNSSSSQAGNPYPQWTTGPSILQHLPKRGCIGYIRPRLGQLTPQGTITKEADDLTAADVQELKEYIHALLVKGYNSAGQNKPGIADIVTTNQRRIAAIPEAVWEAEFTHGGTHSARTELVKTRQEVTALRGAIAALAKNPGISPEQITEAVKAALAESVVDVDVTVNGREAV